VRQYVAGKAMPDEDDRRESRERARVLAQAREDSVLLLTLGRLVRRKGVAWFVQHVLPQLDPACVLLVAGRGPEHDAIAAAATSSGTTNRVRLFGHVDEGDREALLTGCDVFLMPNIRVPGDMEGFGLVAIEAALRGTPVVAADLEGIRDAIVDGVTGILLPSGDPGVWIATVNRLTAVPDGLAKCGAEFAVQARRLYSHDAFAARLKSALERSSSAGRSK
jgi:phosphatidyl-myo-inositol dimannoside synthase